MGRDLGESQAERGEPLNDPNTNSKLGRKLRRIMRFERDELKQAEDLLAAEEPLEIRVVFGRSGKRKDRSLSITMRTPGHDRQLAAGFMLGEGIVKHHDEIVEFEETGSKIEGAASTNQLCVHLAEDVAFDFGSLQRNFYTTSSCGICGKASLEAVREQLSRSVGCGDLKVPPSVITSLPATLREHQATFEETGGIHAAGLFSCDGQFVDSQEDVGRHNAMDKLIGKQFLAGSIPLQKRIIVVSGRASFELVQKVISAGCPVLVAVGAPSSLAAELAEEFGVTLIGFASRNRFNIYSHSNRIQVV